MPDWWTWVSLLLDGAGGAAIAAGVAIWAVRRTIRHERQQERRTSLDAAAIRLTGEATALQAAVSSQVAHDQLRDQFARTVTVATEVIARSTSDHPQFAEVVDTLLKKFMSEYTAGLSTRRPDWGDLEPALATLTALAFAGRYWLQDPKAFQAGWLTAEFIETAVGELRNQPDAARPGP